MLYNYYYYHHHHSGTMTKTATKNCLLKRKGSRTLPLPGQKKIKIVWGQLETTNVCLLIYNP